MVFADDVSSAMACGCRRGRRIARWSPCTGVRDQFRIFADIRNWLCLVLGPEPSLADAVGTGFLVGAVFVATSFGINYQFANRSLRMWLIDSGYHTMQFILFGLILGWWH